MGDFEKLTVSEFTSGPREWEELLARADEPSLVQAWAYGEAKARTSNWTIERVAVRKGAEIVALIQALVRRLPVVGRGLVWINRAPVVIAGGNDYGPSEWAVVLDAHAADLLTSLSDGERRALRIHSHARRTARMHATVCLLCGASSKSTSMSSSATGLR